MTTTAADVETTYALTQVETSPPWLRDPTGTAWALALGTTKDGYLEAAKRAVRARFPGDAPLDALVRLARTFNLDTRLAALLGPEALSPLLAAAWDAWAQSGTKPGLVARLAELGLSEPQIFEAWEWAPSSPRWWRFWVVLQPSPYINSIFSHWPWPSDMLADGTWASPGTWSAGGPWAESVPPAWLALVRATIAKWKPKHAVCERIIFLQSGQTFGTRVRRPDGSLTWAPMAWLPAQISYLEP